MVPQPFHASSALSQERKKASLRITASFWQASALAWGPTQASGEYVLHCGPPWAAGNIVPHHSFHYALQGESLLWFLEHLLTLLLH